MRPGRAASLHNVTQQPDRIRKTPDHKFKVALRSQPQPSFGLQLWLMGTRRGYDELSATKPIRGFVCDGTFAISIKTFEP